MKNTNESLKFNKSYRPDTFSSVIGHNRILKALNNSILMNEVQNAYIFEGEPGLGKTTVARVFAKKIICYALDENNEPCGTCPACTDFKENPFLAGVIEIDGAKNANINDIRALEERLAFEPLHGWNVVIIDEGQDIKGAGASALYKLLEEPPSNTLFIVATTDYNDIPKAIRSRGLRFTFNPVEPKYIKQRLMHICLEQNIQATEQSIDMISRGVNGCVRDAVKILQQASIQSKRDISEADLIGYINLESAYIKKLLHLVTQGDTTEIMLFMDENIVSSNADDFSFIAKRIRNALFNNHLVTSEIKTHLIAIANIFMKYKRDISMYSNTNMALEFASIESAIYLNDNVSERTLLLNIFEDSEDIQSEKDTVCINKKDLFLSMMCLSNCELKVQLDNYDISLDTTGSILKFLVDAEEDKSSLRLLLSSETPQKIKPLIQIDGFVVKLKNDN